MITTERKGTEVRNSKTNSVGIVRCEYISTKTRKLMIEVWTFGRVAHWDASNVEFPG